MPRLRRLVPSGTALFAFEAAARHRSFGKAARELNVTQPAVSQAIKRLEQHLGTSLFVRGADGIRPTDEGAILFDAVASGFHRIELAFDEILARAPSTDVVTLSVSTAMATQMFMPRMAQLQRDMPQVDLRFQMLSGEPAGALDGVDLGVRLATYAEPDDLRWPLAAEQILAVCSPGYLRLHGGLQDSIDGEQHTLLHYVRPRLSWSQFLEMGGIAAPARARTLIFSDYSVIIQAAIAGQGIAMGWTHIVGRLLQEKILVAAAPLLVRTGNQYVVVASPLRPLRPTVAKLRDWLLTRLAPELELDAGNILASTA
ncbi:MAG TPA: LysR family transcriptional regulator [Stellaceae bacterium]|nr:LysR family transcriptional regulator [Stellaceae bacterium]